MQSDFLLQPASGWPGWNTLTMHTTLLWADFHRAKTAYLHRLPVHHMHLLFPSVYRLAGTPLLVGRLHMLTVQSDLLLPRCNTAQHRLPTHLYRSNYRLVWKLLLMRI